MKHQKFILFVSYCLFLLYSHLNKIDAQLYINEFMASNASTLADPDFGDNADWIEIFNDNNYNVSLAGFFLSDNLGNPDKWQFPSDVTLGSKEYLVIWCDGKDSALHTNFKLAQEGEQIGIFSPALTPLDTLSYIHQSPDISFGRLPNSPTNWAYFTEPTPGSSNNTTPYDDRVENVVDFSVFGGIYNSTFYVELSSYLGGTIRYTLDGSEPSTVSTLYSSPLLIDETTILRARIFKTGMIPGKVTTQSYFIDETLLEQDLPVVSIATDPDNFWDPTVGIYAQDFKPDWEVPINIEFFENNGSDRAGFNELAGTKINGLHSWRLPQKMLGIYFRKQYDNTSLEYPVITDIKRTHYESFALRASGSDWSYTLFRDAMIQTSSQLNSDVDIQGFRPCLVFVNGQYLGIHNIREKVNEGYIVGNYGLAESTFDMVENADYAEAGDLEAYNNLIQLMDKDLSIESNYNALLEQMDVENFTDYMSTEIYSENRSVSHNVMAWREKPSGKWRWILTDLDRGFFYPDEHLISYYINTDVFPLRKLLKSNTFKEYFYPRLADHLYTTFNPIRMHQRIDMHVGLIEAEMPNQIERWLGTTSSYGDAIPSMEYWINEIEYLHDFASARIPYLLEDLEQYGYDPAEILDLDISPQQAGYIKFNGFIVPEPKWSGSYPMNLNIDLEAIDKPGYDFLGWTEYNNEIIIPKNATWKYLDTGTDQGGAWSAIDFNDLSWEEGAGELGYGDGDEQTVISYGGDSGNKNITTYFRKSFTLTSLQLETKECYVNLLRDDGAIVYLNGQEVARSNMNEGVIDFQSLAASGVSSGSEGTYIKYAIDPNLLLEGENVIAVEVHQISATSSDLSFDLEFALILNSSSYLSTSPKISISLTNQQHIVANYERNSQCMIPETIDSDLRLTKECSPYVVLGDVTINPSAILTIDPGVEILMAEQSHLFVNGGLIANGTEEERIIFRLNPDHSGEKWGAICFHNTEELSELSYLTIMDASCGPDPSIDVAAISAFYADLKLDNLIIDQVHDNPIAARYSDIRLTNSQLYSKVSGDLINVKYGSAYIENCVFQGNNQPDTDAIDYDDVENGVIRNCKISEFKGFNSDGVDLGEKAKNILIDSLFVYNVTDKGVSVGQESSASVSHSVFINCNLGLGLKDSCNVIIDQCTFYGNSIPVSCYEKNPGSAGGNAIIRNSILSNSYSRSFHSDSKSTLLAEYCISDNTILPQEEGNIFGDPLFNAPDFSDFELHASSPCLDKGNFNGESIDLGAPRFPYQIPADLVISSIFYNPWLDDSKSEFITLTNSGLEVIDLYGYTFSNAIIDTITDHISLNPKEKVFIVKDILKPPGIYYYGQVVQWAEGRLANEGEKITLTDPSGIIVDQVEYSPESPWPDTRNANSEVLSFKEQGLDNHFGYNWTTIPYSSVLNKLNAISENNGFEIFPNPSQGFVTILSPDTPSAPVGIYSLTGELMYTSQLDDQGMLRLNLTPFIKGLYIVKAGNKAEKIILAQ